jgi:hypothetical protein
MSEKIIESNGRAFLILILPLSFLFIFLVSTWRVLLIILFLMIGWQLWHQYKWEKWCQDVDPVFYQMIKENQGKITPIELAGKGNFSGTVAKRYLDNKAKEFGINIIGSETDPQTYYFITPSVLGDILDSSEPEQKISHSSARQNTYALVAPPLSGLLEDDQVESLPLVSDHPEVSEKPLVKQLTFGSLIQSELAKRLNVYSSTVYKRRNDPDFPEWSRSRDPDGIAWAFSRKTREFFPLDE